MTTEEIKELEEDMNDAYKDWQDAEKEIEDAITWRNKKALYYAEYATKFYNAKKLI